MPSWQRPIASFKRSVSLLFGFGLVTLIARPIHAQSDPLLLNDAPSWAHYFCDSSESDPNGSATLQGAHCYPSLTVPSGATITITDTHATPTASDNLPRGEWLAFVNGLCTITGTIKASSINYEYANGGGSGGGGGGAAAINSGIHGDDSNMFGGANYVVTGPTFNNPDFSVIHAAAGGSAGGIGQNGGIGTSPTSASQKWSWMLGDQLTLSGAAGGAGGNGTSVGGAGGYGGGGVVLVCANSIDFTGTIDVSGSAGLSGPPGSINAGGGGGGGGGVVLMATSNYVANSGTIILNGGIGGSAQAGAGTGGNGGAGWSKQFLFGTFTPTPTTATPTNTATPTITITPSSTIFATPTLTPTATLTATPTDTPTLIATPTNTATPTVTVTATDTPTLTATPTPITTPTLTPTATPTAVPETLIVTPRMLNFHKMAVGQTSKAKTITIKAKHKNALPIMVEDEVASTNFQITNGCMTALQAGAKCTVTVVFTPTAAGKVTGTLTINDNAEFGRNSVILKGAGE